MFTVAFWALVGFSFFLLNSFLDYLVENRPNAYRLVVATSTLVSAVAILAGVWFISYSTVEVGFIAFAASPWVHEFLRGGEDA